MAESDSAIPVRYTIIWIGLLVGLGFFAADVIIDVFVFHNGTLIEQLLNPTYHELWMRTCVLLLAVVFAVVVQLLLGRERKAGERARLAENFLNSIVDNIPSMIFIKDAGELRFIRVNHTGEKLLGLTTRELIGRNDFDFFPASQAEFFTRKDREVLASGVEVNIPEEEIDTVTLGKRWLHTRKVPILDDKGQPLYLLGISDDITQARQAESDLKETEIRFQTLFNSAADFIFVIDPEGVILQVNRYACERSGYEKHEVIGNNIKNFFAGESQDTCDRNFPGLRERGYNRADIEFVCKDGHIVQMECMATGVPDESGCFKSFLIIQRDVTDKKRAEAAAQRHQEEIAHVMRLSTIGEMASGMAHELNQPLTALVSYCGAAASMVDSLPSPPLQLGETLERAQEQAHRAGTIIRNLREFVSKGDNRKEPLVLDQLIEEVNVLLDPELRHAGIKVECHPGGAGRRVLANKVQLEQVLINLVRNSLEAIESAGTANGTVTLETRLLSNASIEVTVTDNGPGIDADMRDRIFHPFQTSKASGMGMGLSISRSIVEQHGGALWADVPRRKGAKFGFVLPVCE